MTKEVEDRTGSLPFYIFLAEISYLLMDKIHYGGEYMELVIAILVGAAVYLYLKNGKK